MTDPSTGSGIVTINLPGGGERHLRKCTPSDWMRMTNIFRSVRKVRKRTGMMAAGIPAEEIQASMDRLDKLPLKYDDVEAFFDELDGQYEAILLSLGRENPSADRQALVAEFDALGLHPLRWCGVACALFNIPTAPVGKTGAVEKNEKKENGGPTTPTGEETPSSSPTTSPAPTSVTP